MLYHNIEKSALHRGKYVGWDCDGNRYRIKKEGRVWWTYPQCDKGIPLFYSGTLRLVSLRLERKDSRSCIVATKGESI